ncbi:MAG: AAA family ATPase [Chloroflexi bacterium]|nr:AAA family ATPase [Chloroflexota bacterium]
MPGERIQRQTDALLDEAEAAVRALDWTTVRARTDAVLALDPGNEDALALVSAADRANAAVTPAPVAVAAPAQERRQVTVFFSDLSGFTSLSERLDPEDVRDIVNKVWERAGEIVARYDGRINKLLGDAVMAVFGDPVAHEDDPVRAVRAAMELHDAVAALNRDVEPRIGAPIGMHTGVNTGVVLTSESVLDGKQTGPLGDTINVAARLQSLAETGQILVGPNTRRAIDHVFELEDLGARDLKGKGEPIPVARVLSAAGRQVTPARRSGHFVGRDRELNILHDEWAKTRDGAATFVALSGEAGAGKSRLVEEFRTRIAADATWLEGRAYPFAQNIPYYAITDMVSSRLGIDETDSSETVRAKLEERVGALVGDAAGEVLPPLLQLYDIEGSQGSSIDREVYRERLQESVRTLVQKLAERGPLVLCLQDLHWADPSTIELLRTLATAHLGSAMTLYNFRPEFSFHEGGIREIRLGELTNTDTRELLESLLGSRDVPASLASFLDQRTSGNPFFIEEIVNGLLENRTLTRDDGGWRLSGDFDATSVPTTIRGMIAARIDRLDAGRRAILQEASVIGREFLFTILSQVRGTDAALAAALGDLESADLIRRRDVDADLEYLFKHALTQEVAYSGLLRSKRQELHLRVAQAMEHLLGDRSREYAESIAYHFQHSEAPERSVPYLLLSGKKAIERYALEEAGAHYRAAYDILLAQPPSAPRDHRLLDLINEWCLLHYYLGDINAFKKLMAEHGALLDRVSDPELCGMWLSWHCFVGYASLDLEAALRFADRAIALGESCGSARVLAYAQTQKAWALLNAGRSAEALRCAETALSLVDQLSDERDSRYIRLKALCAVSMLHASLSDLFKARARAKELLEFANTSGSRRALAFAHWSMGALASITGDSERARQEAALAREAAPDPLYQAIIDINLGGSLANAGDAGARAVIERAIRFADEHGLTAFVLFQRANLALVLLLEGELTKGMDELEAVQRQVAGLHSRFWELQVRRGIGLVYAQIAIGEAGSSGGKLGTMMRNPGFVLGRGRKASQTARDLLMDMSEHLPPDLEGFRFGIEFELAKLLVKRKERDEARHHLERAIAFLQPAGDCVGMRDARTLLATLDAG